MATTPTELTMVELEDAARAERNAGRASEVDREHVRYLVNAALRLSRSDTFRWFWNIDHETGSYMSCDLPRRDRQRAAAVGQLLWNACIRSVAHRYPHDTVPDLPGPIGESYEYSTHHEDPHRVMDPVQVLKTCDCYEYQACESPEYADSEAAAFIQSLRKSAVGRLPGYEEAKWGAPDPQRPDPLELARIEKCQRARAGR
jgi:hypothetical protein